MEFESSMLFSPVELGGKVAPNRLVAQPMECNNALEGGLPSDLTRKRYADLARGGWGVIILEAVSITAESLARKNQIVVNERTIPELRKLVASIKSAAPETVVLVQVTHSGVISDPSFSKCVTVTPRENLGYIQKLRDPRDIHELTTGEVDRLLDQFVGTVLALQEVGVDGIDYKSCHGYLGAEFLRPLNTRDDKYGGSFENRTRFFREGIERIREGLDDPEFVLGTRVSFYEAIPGGFGTGGPGEVIEDLREPLEFVKLCERLGLAYLNVSAGIPALNPQLTRPDHDFLAPMYAHFRYAAQAKSQSSKVAIIGSAYSMCRRDLPSVAEKNLRNGLVDLVGLGRQNIADPEFPAHLRTGEFTKVKWCVGCNSCALLLRNQLPVGCGVYDRYYMKLVRDLRREKKKGKQ
ncbi:MAG: oxidoreductase [Promethearchaeota archaeon]